MGSLERRAGRKGKLKAALVTFALLGASWGAGGAARAPYAHAAPPPAAPRPAAFPSSQSPEALRARSDTTRSSADGVYTLAQANSGKDVFASACQSCHTPTVHAGPQFRGRWFGRTLGELFGYLRREMPQADPGSMSDEEYALVMAYLLRINGMPTGSEPLATDSISLHRIRLDSVPTAGAGK